MVLVVIASAIWVYFDADAIGLGGGWAAGTLLIWIVFFPWYLWQRRNVIAARSAVRSSSTAATVGSQGSWQPDPRDPARERWREGERWTRATRAREAGQRNE